MRLIFKDEHTRAQFTQSVLSTGQTLQELVDLFPQMGLGIFTLDKLTGAMSAQGYSEPSQDGCRSCRGLIHYSSARAFVQDFLVDHSPATAQVGGLKLSREKLKSLIELPTDELIAELESKLKILRNSRDYLPFLLLEDDTVYYDEEAVERHCAQFDKWVKRPDDIALLERVEKLFTEINQINGLLESRGFVPLTVTPKSKGFGATNDPLQLVNRQLLVDRNWIIGSLY